MNNAEIIIGAMITIGRAIFFDFVVVRICKKFFIKDISIKISTRAGIAIKRLSIAILNSIRFVKQIWSITEIAENAILQMYFHFLSLPI